MLNGRKRLFDFARWNVLGCLLLLLASGISAQNEDQVQVEYRLILEEESRVTVNKGMKDQNEVDDLNVRYEDDIDEKYPISGDSDSLDAERYTSSSSDSVQSYAITEQRLEDIRSELMYWYSDQGGNENLGDYLKEISPSMPQIKKNLNFELSFFGSTYNYTRISMNGYLEFSDPPEFYTYPLKFPVRGWPKKNDPSFIGIFFSKCRIGEIRRNDIDKRMPGVYFRLERDLQSRKDQFGVEMRERLTWDIREAIADSESFEPKHAAVITWKNISFAGGIDLSLYKTNTFQMVLATDEVSTYAIFNYLNIQWTSHTEAGGDTVLGLGGVPAFIGFNAGNGVQSYEYKPYSQGPRIHDLTRKGWANGFPGRHIFKIDDEIMNTKIMRKI